MFNRSKKLLIFFDIFQKKLNNIKFFLILFFKNFFLLSFQIVKNNLLNFFYLLNLSFINIKFNLIKFFGNFLSLYKKRYFNNDIIFFNNVSKNALSCSLFNIFNISFNNHNELLNKSLFNNFFNYIKKIKFISGLNSIKYLKKILHL